MRVILRLFGVRIGEAMPMLSAAEELRGQLDLLHQEGGVAKVERDMLGGLLDLQELTVSEVMVHRTKMRTINADLSSEDIVREVLSSPYTRLPLWRGSQENIVGVLHAKDLLRALAAVGGDAGKLKVEAIALESWFVPDTHLPARPAQGLPGQEDAFRARGRRIRRGAWASSRSRTSSRRSSATSRTSTTSRSRACARSPDGSVNVDGSVPIRDLNRAMDWELPDEEATTIAGLVIHEAQAIPDAGQIFTFHGFRFQVLRKSRNRITALRITPVSNPPADTGAAVPRRQDEART